MEKDSRSIDSGSRIPVSGYSDQPYIVKTTDGAWLMTVTTGSGTEGASGQHVVSARSLDCGQTWTDRTDVFSADAPESSYSVLFRTEYGRVYCFCNYNADNLRTVIAEDPPFRGGVCTRVDTQGHFIFRYSDDCGKTWSERWYDIPMRRFTVDLENPYHGEILYFWNVGRAFSRCRDVYVPIYKIKAFGDGFMRYSQGALLHCTNIETERDPEKLIWETLPEGMEGIHAPWELGAVSEEHSFAVLSDGSLFCVFRTVTGHPYCSYSRDGGKTFTAPEVLRFADGRPVRHPRAANFIWKCENGKYLYWFHNHGVRAGDYYEGRNPAWLCGAVEERTEDGLRLRFSQPAAILYDDDPLIRMSYPDLVEENGDYYITETQKNLARVHKIDRTVIEGLWAQFDGLSLPAGIPVTDQMPPLPPFTRRDYSAADGRAVPTRACFTLRFSFRAGAESSLLFSTTDPDRGIEIQWQAERRRLAVFMSDGQYSHICFCGDPRLADGMSHEIAVAFDGGAHIVCFSVDGSFYDGGADGRQYGFSRFSGYFLSAEGSRTPSVNLLPDLTYYDGIRLYRADRRKDTDSCTDSEH